MAQPDHLLNIAEVFKAEAATVYDTFATEMGIASFRIPIYQRNYSWDPEKINRLFEDVTEGPSSAREGRGLPHVPWYNRPCR